MNKIMISICAIVSAISVNAGLSLSTKIEYLTNQAEEMNGQNQLLEKKISEEQTLNTKEPKLLSTAFSLVINEMWFLEGYSGTLMNLSIKQSKENDDISNYYIESEYRGIKKLPILIQVEKFSNETDMAAVLNDIYQLELETDFKVNEINKEGNTLNVKGDVYGL